MKACSIIVVFLIHILLLFCLQRDVSGATPGTEKWKYPEFRILSPALGPDGKIYFFRSHSGILNALNPNGTKAWSFETGEAPSPNLAIGHDGIVYAATSDKVHAFRPDGSVKWSYGSSTSGFSSPAIGADGTVYVSCYLGSSYGLVALSPEGGEQWQFTFDWGTGAPVAGHDGTIYAVSGNGTLYAIDPDGNELWSVNHGGPQGESPCIGADGAIYYTAGISLWAIAPDGSLKWEFEPYYPYPGWVTWMKTSPVIGPDGVIYVGSRRDGTGQKGDLWAINPDGSEKWVIRTSASIYTTPAVGADGTVYSEIDDTKVCAFNPDGTFKWCFQAPNLPSGAWQRINGDILLGDDGTVYFGTSDASETTHLFALYGESGGPATDSPWPLHRNNQRRSAKIAGKKVVLPLSVGASYTGRISGWQFAYFSVETETGRALLVRVTPESADSDLVGDASVGALPRFATSGEATARTPTADGNYDLLVSPTLSATYYVSIFGNSLPDGSDTFTISAQYIDNYLSGISPSQGGDAGLTTMTVTGLGFQEGDQVTLQNASSHEIVAQSQTVADPSVISAFFDLAGAPAGPYDLVVTWTAGGSSVLPEAFEVTADGFGPVLDAWLEPPPAVRPLRKHLGWLKFKNTGDSDLPAPIFKIASNTGLAVDINDEYKAEIDIMGTGGSETPDVIRSGEKIAVPFYFQGPAYGDVNLGLSIMRDSEESSNWPAHKDAMKPDDMDETEWDLAWPDLAALLGDTQSDYLDAMRQTGVRLQARGKTERDVRKLLDFNLDLASGMPCAAISGTLRDADTGEVVPAAVARARSLDNTVLKQDTTAFHPAGQFCFSNLPDGDYELTVAGYDVEPPFVTSVTGQQDTNDVVFYARKLPEIEDDPARDIWIPDHFPSVARDAVGNLYLAFNHGPDLWTGRYDENGWRMDGKMNDVGGNFPRVFHDAALLDDGTMPGIFVVWQTDESPFTVYWSAGKISGGEMVFSVPDPLKTDEYDDMLPVAAIGPNGSPVIVWLQRNPSIYDDTDLYFQSIDLSSVEFSEKAPAKSFEISDERGGTLQYCHPLGAAAKGGSIPKWVPILGGDYGIGASFEACAGIDCSYSISGDASLEAGLGSYFKIDGSVSGSASWRVDDKQCSYVFDQAEVNISGGGTVQIPYLIPTILGIFTLHLDGSANAFVGFNWENTLYSYPDSGSGQLSVAGGGGGGYSIPGEIVSIDATVMYGATWQWDNALKKLVKQPYCVTIEVEANAAFFEYSWEKGWGDGCGKQPPDLEISEEDSLKKSGYDESGGVPVYYIFEQRKVEHIGTGRQGNGKPIFPDDIPDNFHNEKGACLAVAPDGDLLLSWAKEKPADELGSQIFNSGYSMDGWEDMSALSPSIGFAGNLALVFDSDGAPMAVWPWASNAGLDFDTTPVADINQAMDASDLYYSQRIDGTWTTPSVLATLPGKDHSPALAASSNGEIAAVWLNETENAVEVYAAMWSGDSWGTPEVLGQTEGADKPVAAYSRDGLMALWAQDADDDPATFDDWRIFFSLRDTSQWSVPAFIAVSEETGTDKSFVPTRSASNHPFEPPATCCKGKPDRPDLKYDPNSDYQVDGVTPIDPNEKEGSPGETENNYISPGDRIFYTVAFENLETAEAPAQEVIVTDTLDSNLDWNTLQIESVSFGDTVVGAPAPQPWLSDRVTIDDHRDTVYAQWLVDIQSDLDFDSGRLEVRFKTLDPATEDFPYDPYAGFLPPEDGTGRGKGSVSFSVQAKDDLAPETEIANTASIVFDTNDPIATQTVIHTIYPPSFLSALPEKDIEATGMEGGPFSFSNAAITLKNTQGGTDIQWEINTDADWLNIDPSAGELAPGESETVEFSTKNNARDISPGTVSNTIDVVNLTNGQGDRILAARLVATFSGHIWIDPPPGDCNGNRPCYSGIGQALQSSATDAAFDIRGTTFAEGLEFAPQDPRKIEIRGGWDQGFSAPDTATCIAGPFTIENSTVTVDRLVLGCQFK